MILIISFFLFLIGLLYGMYLIRSALFNLLTNTLRQSLENLTSSPWKGIFVGIFIAVISQSSFTLMVFIVGLVSARLLTFSKSIPIMLGANIGITIIYEFITIDLKAFFLPIALVGAILCYIKIKNSSNIGYTLIGLSLVFCAMWGIEIISSPLKNIDFLYNFFLTLDHNHLFAILFGMVFSVIIQSNTAVTGFTMGFLSKDILDVTTGFIIMLGANIGTCIIVLLATIRSRNEAMLTAFAYTWINVLGVAIIYPFINLLVTLGTNLASSPDIQLAHISVIYHILITLMFLPFINQFKKFIKTVHDNKE